MSEELTDACDIEGMSCVRLVTRATTLATPLLCNDGATKREHREAMVSLSVSIVDDSRRYLELLFVGIEIATETCEVDVEQQGAVMARS